MSNSPMRGDAGYRAGGAEAECMHCAEIQRKRDELSYMLAVLLQARRRLDEIGYDAGGQLVPGAGAAAAAVVDASSYTADNEFYPVGDDDDEPEQRPMEWQDQVCRQMVYSSRRLHRHDDLDGGGHLADSDTHDLDIDVDDDDAGDEISRDIVALRLHVPRIQQQTATTTLPPFVPRGLADGGGGGGFGAVPASTAAIAGLKKHRYDGSGGDSMCVICMRDYKKGRSLHVMPCAHKHRFHGRCIRRWLARSNLCPLCRHALPTADAEQGEAGGGVNRRLLVRVNVNPY